MEVPVDGAMTAIGASRAGATRETAPIAIWTLQIRWMISRSSVFDSHPANRAAPRAEAVTGQRYTSRGSDARPRRPEPRLGLVILRMNDDESASGFSTLCQSGEGWHSRRC